MRCCLAAPGNAGSTLRTRYCLAVSSGSTTGWEVSALHLAPAAEIVIFLPESPAGWGNDCDPLDWEVSFRFSKTTKLSAEFPSLALIVDAFEIGRASCRERV